MRLMLLLFFTLSFSSWGQSPGKLSAAQALARSAWKPLNFFMEGCLRETRKCGLTSDEAEILAKINAIHAAEFEKTTIEFLPGSDPRFQMGGAPRAAVTGSSPFSPIYLNAAIIAPEGQVNMPWHQMISLLVHELGHHLGIGDTEERLLDRIGNAVGNRFSKEAEQFEYSANPLIRGFFYNVASFEELKSISDPALRFPVQSTINGGGEDWKPITLGKKLLATSITNTAGASCPSEASVLLVHVANARWESLPPVPAAGASAKLVADMRVLCGQDIPSAKELTLKLAVSFKLSRFNDVWVFNVKETSLLVFLPGDENRVDYQVEDVTVNTVTMNNGGEWKIKVVVRLDATGTSGLCAGYLNSLTFPHSTQGVPLEIAGESCEAKSLGGGLWELNFRQSFPATVPSGTFTLRVFQLLLDKKIKVNIELPRRLALEVRNPAPGNIALAGVRLLDQHEVDRSQEGIRNFTRGEKYQLVFSLKGVAPGIIGVRIFEHLLTETDRPGVNSRTFFNEKLTQERLKISRSTDGAEMILTLDWDHTSYNGMKMVSLMELELLTKDFRKVSIKLPAQFVISR